MNIIAFDTSTEKFSIVIIKKNKVVLKFSKTLKKTYSKYLISILKNCLYKANLKIKNINLICVSLGPGSFTGIRLGIAAAKGLAIPHEINLFGFNNMDILINSLKNFKSDKRIITIIKSKKNDFYYQIFNSKKKPIKKMSFFSINKLPKFLFNQKNIFVGDRDLDLMKKIKKKNKKIIFEKKNVFNVLALKNILKNKYLKNKFNSLEPIYIYEHYAKKI